MAIDGGSTPWTYQIQPQATLSALRLNPADGRQLAYATNLSIAIIDVDNPEEVVASQSYGFSYAANLDWHPSRAVLATTNPNRTVSLHHIARDALRSESFAVHDDVINACAFTTTALISVSDDATVRALSLDDGAIKVIRRLQGAGVAVRVVGERVLVGQLNGTIHLLDERQPATASAVTFQTPYPLMDADLSFPYVGVVTDHTITLYDVRRPAVPAHFHKIALPASAPTPQKIRFAPGDTRVFATSQTNGIAVWDVEQQSLSMLMTHKIAPTGLEWHSTQMVLYTGDDYQVRRFTFRSPDKQRFCKQNVCLLTQMP